jgi:type VI protein secretion system component VasK
MKQSGSKSRIFLVTLLMLFGTLTFTSSGCRILKRDKQSAAEKKQAEADKKASEEYEKAKKQHYKHQSKDAKKMMKQTKKEAAKINKPLRKRGLNKTKCK